VRYHYIRHHERALSPDEQAAALAALPGASATSRVDETETGNAARDAMLASLAGGDEVAVAAAVCLGTSVRDVQSAVRAALLRGASVLTAMPPRTVAPDSVEAILLLDDVIAAKAHAATATARSARGPAPAGRARAITPEDLEAARRDWADTSQDRAAVASRYGVSERTLYRQFGPRGPGFTNPVKQAETQSLQSRAKRG
jgi:hypothetical protein